jgi:tetratricopeptide (TPR) repeat protein
VITLLVQKHGGAQSDPLPIFWRIGNALTASVTYIGQMIWPASLAPFYPHPGLQLAPWKIAAASDCLARAHRSSSAAPARASLSFYRLVLVSRHARAGDRHRAGRRAGARDRYTYLPQIGLAICVVWAAAELSRRFRFGRVVFGTSGALVLLFLGAAAWVQAGHWRDSETLWTHTLKVTENNAVAHLNLGQVLFDRGQIDDALGHYEAALRVHRSTSRFDLLLAVIHTNLGSALRHKGRSEEAIAHFPESNSAAARLRGSAPEPRPRVAREK